MPEPLSRNSGLGMNVTVLLYFLATFLMMYLYMHILSAIFTSVVEPQVDFATGRRWPLRGAGLRRRGRTRSSCCIISLRMSISGVGRRHGEVAFLVAQLVAEVGLALRRVILAAVPLAFVAIEVEVAAVGRLVEADVVEDEELGLGADEAGVGDAGALQVVDRLAGDVARDRGV